MCDLAQVPIWFLVFLIAYLYFFYNHGRGEKETGGKEHSIKKGVDRSKSKLGTKVNDKEICKRRH